MTGRASTLLLLSTLALMTQGCPGPADSDGDGHVDAEDCAPDDPGIHPGALDPWGDDLDANCDGADGVDADGDGWPVDSDPDLQQPDCDDDDPDAWPGRPWEDPTDGVDADCDGTDFSGLERGAFATIVGAAHADSGTAVAGGGDIDGDGLADVLVGEPRWHEYRGRVLVFLGSTLRAGGSFPADEADFIVTGVPGLPIDFGVAVAFLGDVDGDGLDDFAVGATNFWGLEIGGRVRVVLAETLLAAGRLSADEAIEIESPVEYMDFGCSVAGGDIDGDGAADLLVGSAREVLSEGHASAAYVFLADTLLAGSALSAAEADHALRSARPTAGTGRAVAMADFDGDANVDLLAGTESDLDMPPGGLKVLLSVSLDPPPSSTASPDYSLAHTTAWQRPGRAVAGLSDLDSDGGEEVAVGVLQNSAKPGPGLVWVLQGQPGMAGGGEMELPDLGFSLSGQAGDTEFGRVLGGGGDLDGDDTPDLVVGSWSEEGGRAYVFSGDDLLAGFDGGAPAPRAVFVNDNENEWTGTSVAIAGDIDGDGLDDIAIGGRGWFADNPPGAQLLGTVDIVLGYAGP